MSVRGGGGQDLSLEMNYRFYWRLRRWMLWCSLSWWILLPESYATVRDAPNSWVLVGLLVGTKWKMHHPKWKSIEVSASSASSTGISRSYTHRTPLTSSWQWILRTLAALINRLHLENHKTFNWFPRLWSRLHSCNDPTLRASSICNFSSRWRISVFFCGLAWHGSWSGHRRVSSYFGTSCRIVKSRRGFASQVAQSCAPAQGL